MSVSFLRIDDRMIHGQTVTRWSLEYPCDGERTCRYIDDYHLEVGTNLYHICEFAELCERNGHTVEPAAKENTKSAKDKEKTR